MSEPHLSEAELQAFVDGRLDAPRRAAVEAWLAGHPEDAERVADYRRIAQALRAAFDPVLDEPVPQRLTRTPGAGRAWPRYAAVAGWIALGAALGAVTTWQWRDAPRPNAAAVDMGSTMARRAALAHATYSPEVRHPVEVGADQEAHLVAWLSKRLGTPVQPPKLDAIGYSLMGGRLLPGDNGPVAHFMYQCTKGTRVTLYLRAGANESRETAFRYAEERNVRVFYWIDRKFGYAISSADISRDDLYKVANTVYQQFNP